MDRADGRTIEFMPLFLVDGVASLDEWGTEKDLNLLRISMGHGQLSKIRQVLLNNIIRLEV